MKFLVLVKATKRSEAGVHPDEKVILEMMRFNEEMVNAGVLLDAGGLWPSGQGKRIRVDGTIRHVTDGPFTESKELIGGYWMVQAKSFDEVMEWMTRCPALHEDGSELEIRRLIDVGDFPAAGAQATALHQRLEAHVRGSLVAFAATRAAPARATDFHRVRSRDGISLSMARHART